MNKDKSEIIFDVAQMLLQNNEERAKAIIVESYPHRVFETEKRTYSIIQKMEQFMRDGFIDRYTGQKLVNPGILKVLSVYFPDEFPFHPHWKMTETHIAYWELIPTIDHIYPIAKGGQDNKNNWVTTSMKNNSIKSNYTIDEIHWNLYPQGDIKNWDGLTDVFLNLVDNNKILLDDKYIKTWYDVSKMLFGTD
ncbi:MAG: HNH endonuclease [Clostridia bacterium]|nr:HNH endonuclease [Clostridia bacterium]